MVDTARDPAIELEPVPAREPDTRGLFDRIKGVVGDESFEREFGLLTVERVPNVALMTGEQHEISFPTRRTGLPDPGVLEGIISASESNHGIILIEEINKQWFEFLDAIFGLDPTFVLAYAKGERRTPSERRHGLDQPLVDSVNFKRGEKSKWCVLAGHSTFRPEDCDSPYPGDSTSYWRHRMGQGSKGLLKSNAAFCYLSSCIRKYEPFSASTTNVITDEHTVLIITEQSPVSDFPRGINLLDSTPLRFKSIDIPWSITRNFYFAEHWHGHWYSLHRDLCEILGNTSDGTLSSNLEFNLVCGIDKATNVVDENDRLGLEFLIRIRSQLLLQLTATFPLQRTISCLSDELSKARLRAQSSPSSDTYLPLLAFRRTLANFAICIARVKHSTSCYEDYFAHTQQPPKRSVTAAFQHIDAQLDQMNKDLREEIPLIIGAVTVQDADLARQQSERATLLTLLAAIYLPLTLVTGIFGMNIRDIDDGKPEFWWCIIVLIVIVGLTLVAYLGFRWWQRESRSNYERRRKNDMENGLLSGQSSDSRTNNKKEADGRLRFEMVANLFKGKAE